MRNAYLNTLYELAAKDKNVLSLVSDNGLIVYDKFRQDFPKQYFNFGISESNMIAAAAGMAYCGKIPFAYTIGAFLAYRGFEFIRDDVCLQKQNVKIVGIGSGMAYSNLGPTHHTTEDIAVLRVLPYLTLFSPASPLEVKKIIQASYEIQGPVYIRLGTNNENEIYDEDYVFQVGKGVEVRAGTDITLISTGSIINEVLEAASQLEKDGVSVRVINIHTLKPFDQEIVIQAAKETKLLITIEEHNIIGGLGSAVAECICEAGIQAKLKKIGLVDHFAVGYGTHQEVKAMNNLGGNEIYDGIIGALK
jgi:transketolase